MGIVNWNCKNFLSHENLFLQKFIYMYVKETHIMVFICKTLVTIDHTVTIMVNKGGKCISLSFGDFTAPEEGLSCSQSKYATFMLVCVCVCGGGKRGE